MRAHKTYKLISIPAALLLMISLFLASPVLAVNMITGISPDEIIVSTKPPVTGKIADAHVRLIEFMLQTRMTIAQKLVLFRGMNAECPNMTPEEFADFASAPELLQGISEIIDSEIEAVRRMLLEEYIQAALDSPDDQVAKVFVQLNRDDDRKLIVREDLNITYQAANAFIEYLAFLANPDAPKWYNEKDAESIRMRLQVGFAGFSEDEQYALEDFELSWFLIRAAWQDPANQNFKNAWRKEFSSVNIIPGRLPSPAQLRKALSIDIYSDLLDRAVMSGVDPIEFSMTSKRMVW
ncbi:MAG: hypothetical protein GX221_01170 [Candidatus Riflebacteria bacterium]|nr:hypothetical protein [Candidatus Riflebacteria bacterium]